MKSIWRSSLLLALLAMLPRTGEAALQAQGMQEAIEQYRQLAAKGGWPSIPEGPELKKGVKDERVAKLRTRLAKTGDLDPSLDNGKPLFDEAVEKGVMAFQMRHGEEGDGVIGPETLQALNISAEDRLHQLETNLERVKSLTLSPSGRAIVVNIPDFTLTAVEGGKIALTMKVVVGKEVGATPAFSDEMEYIVFNPYWNIPTDIAKEETIPKIRKDPGYLAKNELEVVKGDGDDAKVLDPGSIDWSSVGEKLPFRIRQKPGPKNSLGQIKFMMPNKEDIYLHDTPADNLFDKSERAYSHGCIRLEKPVDLAEFVLKGDPAWTREAIVAAMDSKENKKATLKEKIPVHLVYQTAWVQDGKVQFREDVYKQDNQPVQTEGETAKAEQPAGK